MKPHLPLEQQVDLLQTRGLVIGDKGLAQGVLGVVNYYRFTGYAIPFMISREQFKTNVMFEHVLQAIRLDERLRDLLAMALEWIEIDFRTTFAYEHSKAYGALGYKDNGNFQDKQKHGVTLTKVETEIENSREPFILHFKRKREDCPVWAMVEVVSFGSVVHLYKNMRPSDPSYIAIARHYEIRSDFLGSYMQHISVVRNLCAHHTRLWDKNFYGVRPLLSWKQAMLNVSNTQKLFYTVLLIYRLTRHLPTICFDRSAWKNDVIALLKEFNKLPNCSPFSLMGIPDNGFESVWWES